MKNRGAMPIRHLPIVLLLVLFHSIPGLAEEAGNGDFDAVGEFLRYVEERLGSEADGKFGAFFPKLSANAKPLDYRILETNCAEEIERQIALRQPIPHTLAANFLFAAAELWTKSVSSKTIDRMGVAIAKLWAIAETEESRSGLSEEHGFEMTKCRELVNSLSPGWTRVRFTGLKGIKFKELLFQCMQMKPMVPINGNSLESYIAQLDAGFRDEFYKLLFDTGIDYERGMDSLAYAIMETPAYQPTKDEVKRLIATNEVPGRCQFGFSFLAADDPLATATIASLLRSENWRHSDLAIDLSLGYMIRPTDSDLRRKVFTRLHDQLSRIEAGFPNKQPYESLDKLRRGMWMVEKVVSRMAKDCDPLVVKQFSRELRLHADWLVEQTKHLPLSDESVQTGPDPYKWFRESFQALSDDIKKKSLP